MAILARLRSEVRYGKSEKAALVAVAVAVFAVIKEQRGLLRFFLCGCSSRTSRPPSGARGSSEQLGPVECHAANVLLC